MFRPPLDIKINFNKKSHNLRTENTIFKGGYYINVVKQILV